MILDNSNLFSDSQAVTATAISTNVIDLDPGADGPTLTDIHGDAWLVVKTVVAATDVGSDATLTVTLESDSTANLATSATVHYSTGALAFATFSPAGSTLAAVKLPKGRVYERYLGVRYTVASGPLTAGNFTAGIVTDIDSWSAYPAGYTVS